MSFDLANLSFEEHPIQSVVDNNGNPWFRGEHVCIAIGIVNSSQALGRLDDDEKKTIKVKAANNLCSTEIISRGKPPLFINESGLYRLLMGARIRKNDPRHQTIKRFQRWLAHEVIPAIRKTGGYIAPSVQTPSDMESIEAAVEHRVSLVEQKFRIELLALESRVIAECSAGFKSMCDLRNSDIQSVTRAIENLAARTSASESLSGIHRTTEMDLDDPDPMTLRDYATRCRVLDEYGHIVNGKRLAAEGNYLARQCRDRRVELHKVTESDMEVNVYPVHVLDRWRIAFDDENRRPSFKRNGVSRSKD